MRKNIFLLSVLCTAFFIFGCAEHNWTETVVTNNSTFEVKFKFRHTDEYTLAPGAKKSFETAAHQSIEYYRNDKRVLFNYTTTNSGAQGSFENRQSYTVKVNNALSVPAALNADGWMDAMENIPSGDTDDAAHTGTIYTDKPVFTVEAEGFPAAAIFQKTGDTFLVTIRQVE